LSSTSSISTANTAQSDLPLHTREPLYLGLSLNAWFKIAVVSILLIITFRFNLQRLWLKTNPINGEPNWGHAIVIPPLALYYLYLNRKALLSASVQTAWTGLVPLVGGLFIFAWAIYPGQNDFIKDFGMVVTIFGVVLLLCGWAVMKIAWFPIAFLICGIPWPGLIYSWVAGPLQALAAKVAVWTLQITGVQAEQAGTKIFITVGEGFNQTLRTLNVAEACAGLRSLMTFITVGAVVAFFSSRPLWQKVILTLSAIPIAIFCNVMRVAGQGLLDTYVSHELSESFAHQFVGMVMLVPAFFLLLLMGWVMDQLFVEEVDPAEALAKRREATVLRRKPPVPSGGSAAAASASTTSSSESTTARDGT
jgi:exosortase